MATSAYTAVVSEFPPRARTLPRASEVAGLKFADIDWRNGRLAVCGKGRRQEWLPLPQEVGAAILAYLRHDRLPCRHRRCSPRSWRRYAR